MIFDLSKIEGTEMMQGISPQYGTEMTYTRNGDGLDELVALGRQVLDVDLSDVDACGLLSYADPGFHMYQASQHPYDLLSALDL